VSLDVRAHVVVAPLMPTWIAMIRICQISAKYRSLPPVDELPYPARTPEHASIRVHSHDDDVFNAAFLQKREQLVPVIGHGIARGDFDCIDLMSPWVR
jgi:hypothetical protein